jgi:hypothetical protein
MEVIVQLHFSICTKSFVEVFFRKIHTNSMVTVQDVLFDDCLMNQRNLCGFCGDIYCYTTRCIKI